MNREINHGTYGYRKHHRLGEQACPACRAAMHDQQNHMMRALTGEDD